MKTSSASQSNCLPYYKRKWRQTCLSPPFSTLFILISVQGILISSTSQDSTQHQYQCPWTKDIRVPSALKSRCQCAKSPGPSGLLSIQCHDIEASQLVSLLSHRGKVENLELLYLNSSRVTDSNGQVPPSIFKDVKITSLQMSGCGIKSLHDEAFKGQESTLKHLSLTTNQLKEAPKRPLANLVNLSLLDLSHNRITQVPNNSFQTLTKLTTLKLNDNNLQLEPTAFKGLENSLKNLNLKGTRLTQVPEAIGNLSLLGFLDLAQNRIRELDPSPFRNVHSLSALNLERNLLQNVPSSAFRKISSTLSSLSLLNNLLTQFPRDALEYLHELKVLDLGFNLLTELPQNAFEGLTKLTLLALDGNPLPTLPVEPFANLNKTLRGLSLGGRFLSCDCRIRWIADWVQWYDLQITSRERNPQFCGNPPELRRLTFYELKHEDFHCEPNMTSSMSTVTSTITRVIDAKPLTRTESKQPKVVQLQTQNGKNETLGNSHRSTGTDSINVNVSHDVDSIRDVLQKAINKPSPSTQNAAENAGIGDMDDSPFYQDLTEEAESKASTFRPLVKQFLLIPSESQNQNTTTKNFTQITSSTANQHVNKSAPKPVISTTSSTSTIISSAHNGRSLQSTPTQATNPALSTVLTTKKPTYEFKPGADFDDSRIPVISGHGPRLGTSVKPASIVKVRVTPAPTPTTTTTTTVSAIKTSIQRVKTSTAQPSTPETTQHNKHVHVHPPPSNDLAFPESSDIEITDIERLGESILVQWESTKQGGFRIIYRMFGEDTFRHGPPLAPSEREYRIQNIPFSECIVICVVPYEEIVYNEISTSPSAIPPGSQCREMKPSSSHALMNHMEKVTIGASVAIFLAILIAVFIFIVITRRAKQNRLDSPIMSKIQQGSFSTPSPRPGPLPIIPAGSMAKDCDWDQLSGISTRSIPRARVYNTTMDGSSHGTVPSRVILPGQHSHHHHQGQQGSQPRSVHESSNRSYLSSHHSHHNTSYNHRHSHAPVVNSYLNNQSRLLRASMGGKAFQEQSLGNPKSKSSKSGSRHTDDSHRKRRPENGTRFSTCDSINTLSGYDTPDNWTDHDMDVYVAQNATRRDLVQL